MQDLLHKELIRESYPLCNCSAFHVNENVEIERGVHRLVKRTVKSYKAIRWIRYPILIEMVHLVDSIV